MTAPDTLDAQLAQRLFGWEPLFLSADPFWRWRQPDGGYAHDLPPYTTDPAATALVWQWLETRGMPLGKVELDYADGLDIQCVVQCGRLEVDGWGATWPEALCRAALALAEALEGER